MKSSLSPHSEEIKNALRAAHAFLEAFEAGDPIWISLLGGSGVGKTHLSKEILQSVKLQKVRKRCPNSASGWRETQQKKQFFEWRYIVDKIRKGDWGIIDYVCDEVDLLVIDDLGTSYDSELTKTKLSEIANRRLGKATIFTSNLYPEQISEQIDQRVASRMYRNGSKVIVYEKTKDWCLIEPN